MILSREERAVLLAKIKSAKAHTDLVKDLQYLCGKMKPCKGGIVGVMDPVKVLAEGFDHSGEANFAIRGLEILGVIKLVTSSEGERAEIDLEKVYEFIILSELVEASKKSTLSKALQILCDKATPSSEGLALLKKRPANLLCWSGFVPPENYRLYALLRKRGIIWKVRGHCYAINMILARHFIATSRRGRRNHGY